MKRHFVFGLCIALTALMFTACGPKGTAPAAGSASPDDMLKMLPADAMGVFFVDAHAAMAIEAVDKSIREDDDYQKYLDFVEATGIDPKEDIHFLAAAILQEGLEGENGDGAAVVNLKYDPETLLTVIREKSAEEGKEYQEVDYNGHTIYMMQPDEENGKAGGFSFLDDSNAVVGSEAGLKAILDVVDGTKPDLSANTELSALIAKMRKDTLLWGAMMIPAEAAAQAAGNPMMASLSSIKALTMNFDYKNGAITAEIKGISDDSTKNDQIVAALNGIKAFGSMAAAEKPEIGELMEAIKITAAEDGVNISASLSEDLITRLKASAKSEEE